MKLKYGLTFRDLYCVEGLQRLDAAFLVALGRCAGEMLRRLQQGRLNPDRISKSDESQLLIDLAPYLEDFLGDFFELREALPNCMEEGQEGALMAKCKRQFIQRVAARQYTAEDVQAFKVAKLQTQLEGYLGGEYTDLAFSQAALGWMEDQEKYKDECDVATRWAALHVHSIHKSPLFQLPQKRDTEHLVLYEHDGQALITPAEHCVERDGFDRASDPVSAEHAHLASHYCIWCHNQGKDSCRTGLSGEEEQNGCPLDEKISEMNHLRAQGNVLGALAVAMVDNPLLAGTGNRICNDCMKACIFQKQDPVDIPAIETQTLDVVLALPYGFEIYSLLTRWNPMNLRKISPGPKTDHRILVAGMGPAGYTLAHYLLNEGHTVVGIDGLKLEPLSPELLDPSQPIKEIGQLYENLSERVMGGFGGVAEYGITVRWNKNYLKVIRLLLERRDTFHLRGGVRLGGTLMLKDCKVFDHVALCMGAGRPNLVPMKNALARGVRMASDFLMSLQLTGAAKRDSIANLQVRLPIAVIGGGLTAIDTATEALAYYPVQVEKFAVRYQALAAELGEGAVQAQWTPEDKEVATAFLAHAQLLREERTKAKAEKRLPRIRELLQSWGGSTVVYRKQLTDSPAYRLNHEEVASAMKQGVRIVEEHTPTEVALDQWGHARALKCKTDQGETELPAQCVLVAAGTHPNTTLAREEAGIEVMGEYFEAMDEFGQVGTLEQARVSASPCILLGRKEGVQMSFFGDLHPAYAGNVVQAMASAKHGYPVISRVLTSVSNEKSWVEFDALLQGLQAHVHTVTRLGPRVVEVVVYAPQAANNFYPGQFFRLQNYETLAPKVRGTTLAMEGLAVTGARVDKKKGLISTLILEIGGSSDVCQLLKPGEPCVLMGPTGTPTHIPSQETVLLVGGGVGNAVLFSIGQAMRKKGCRVLYFAGYRQSQDRFKVKEIEAASDQIVWCCDTLPGFSPTRPQDRVFQGNIIGALEDYAKDPGDIRLQDVDRILTIGSDGLMQAVAQARSTVLKPYLKPDHTAIGSINSPMQCMMKEICAQCLQPHKNPETGEVSMVFSCTKQDQPLDWVDFKALHERLGQNGLQEKLTALWVQQCLTTLPAA